MARLRPRRMVCSKTTLWTKTRVWQWYLTMRRTTRRRAMAASLEVLLMRSVPAMATQTRRRRKVMRWVWKRVPTQVRWVPNRRFGVAAVKTAKTLIMSSCRHLISMPTGYSDSSPSSTATPMCPASWLKKPLISCKCQTNAHVKTN